jgi:hypothetical protein
MSSVIDLEAQQATQAAPRAGAFFPLSHHHRSVTARNEEVEGAETREMVQMDNLGPLTSNVASSPRSASTGQDISDEAQPVVSHVEGVTPIWPSSFCLIPRRLFCSVTGSGGSDAPEMNIDRGRGRDNVGHTTSDRLTQAEAQIRACFLTIVESSMT